MPQSAQNNGSRALIDHVVITVGDQLDATADRYRRLGFNLTERGHHTLGSSNHLAVFETDYLELLGFLPGRQTSRTDLLRDPPGLTGLVFKPGDLDARYADLKARGVPVEDTVEFSRPVVLAEGVREARFRVLRIAADQVINGCTFFCHHDTPELVWRKEWQQHPNGTTGVAAFIVADPARTAKIYDRMFGPGVLTSTRDGVRFRAGAATVSILDDAELARRFDNAAQPSLDGSDRMVALVLVTKSVAQARTHLDRGGIPHAPYDTGIVGRRICRRRCGGLRRVRDPPTRKSENSIQCEPWFCVSTVHSTSCAWRLISPIRSQARATWCCACAPVRSTITMSSPAAGCRESRFRCR